eukprot:gene7318-9972_t
MPNGGTGIQRSLLSKSTAKKLVLEALLNCYFLRLMDINIQPHTTYEDTNCKTSASTNFAPLTPNNNINLDQTGSDDDQYPLESIPIDDILMTFSGLKIYPGATKRTIDRRTIEGSPVVESFSKRIDLHPTPIQLSKSVPLNSISNLTEIPSKTEQIYNRANNNKVKVICSSSDGHETGEHQENALRTSLLCGKNGCLRRVSLQNNIDWIEADCINPASLTDLLKVHEYSYLNHLENKSRQSAFGNKENHNSDGGPSFKSPPNLLDPDTPLMAQSLEAAKLFCGAAMQAVDLLMNEASSTKPCTAFVVGRPPGHHAGPNGCVPSEYHWQRPDMTSSGFCLLNTVAVAAAYARSHYGRLASINSNPSHPPRIAIIDIDIHHGNGTEEIVRNLRPRKTYLPLPPSWAPIAIDTYKPWFNENDADDVLFSSVHLFAEEKFYPCSGRDLQENNVVNIALTPLGPGPWDKRARAKLTASQREELCTQASIEFRTKVSSMLLPRLSSFQPDIVFISAGFDAHYDDLYHFLTEEDVHWITTQIRTNVGNNTKIISVLEGGYSLSSTITTISTKKIATVAKVNNDNNNENNVDENVNNGMRPSRSNKAKRPGWLENYNEDSNNENRKAGVTNENVHGNVAAEDLNLQNNNRGRKPKKKGSSDSKAIEEYGIFAQCVGDGGLVKGVLAHVAALAGLEAWK